MMVCGFYLFFYFSILRGAKQREQYQVKKGKILYSS